MLFRIKHFLYLIFSHFISGAISLTFVTATYLAFKTARYFEYKYALHEGNSPFSYGHYLSAYLNHYWYWLVGALIIDGAVRWILHQKAVEKVAYPVAKSVKTINVVRNRGGRTRGR